MHELARPVVSPLKVLVGCCGALAYEVTCKALVTPEPVLTHDVAIGGLDSSYQISSRLQYKVSCESSCMWSMHTPANCGNRRWGGDPKV